MTRQVVRLLLVLAALVGTPVLAAAQSEVVEYYATDALGSIRVVFDAAGNVTGRADYRPFGQLFASSGNQKHVYAGIFSDPETDLDFAPARMYQPRTGRLTRLDPVYAGLFEPQKWNRYAYALNSPLGFTDPSGAETQTVNCELGAYWCPGAIQSGKDGDKYFDPRQYGYQGGEEAARAEAKYVLNVTIGFAEKVEAWLQKKREVLKGDVRIKINGHYLDEGEMTLSMMPLSPGAIGLAGEEIVAGLASIGKKAAFSVNGRNRIADGLLPGIVAEIKNVAYQTYTRQLKDYVAYAAENPGMRVNLWVRGGLGTVATKLSGPLEDAYLAGKIVLKTFPWP